MIIFATKFNFNNGLHGLFGFNFNNGLHGFNINKDT